MEAMDIKYKTVVFPNGGAAKKVKPAAVAPAIVGAPMYRECLKNHAASLGGHALDGCGEFMPSQGADPADPSSLKCAACGCHRNFHRRTVEGSSPPPTMPAPLALPAPVPAGVLRGQPQRREDTPEDRLPAVVDGDDSDSDSDASEYDEERSVSPPPPHLHHAPAPVAQQPPPPPYYPSAPHMLLSLGSGAPGAAAMAAAGAQSRLPAQLTSPSSAPAPGGAPPRKRFRTKFTPEQKQRMQELSERLGWRLQKRDEAIVDEWCRDIGVGKGVFKVWMHNNKHNFLGGHSARRSASASAGAAPAATAHLHAPTAPSGSAPPFLPSSSSAPSPPPPPVLSSSPPAATGFININGVASSAPAGHQENINGPSSPQSA